LKFPDKPIATAGIGVACALALLVLLSWPALYGATNSADYVTSGVPAANSGTTVYQTASSSQIVSSATAVETTVSTIAAGSNIDNTSHGSAPSSATIESATTTASTNTVVNGGGTTMPTTITTIATTVVNQGTVVNVSGTTVTTLEPGPSAQPVFAFNYACCVASSSGSSHYSAFVTLAVISIAALIIAVGSMLFVSRRVNSGKASES